MSHAPVRCGHVIVPQAIRQGDPADAERLHRAHEGHLAGAGDRATSRSCRAGREVQAETFNSSALTLGARHVHRGHDPARTTRRPADRPPAVAADAGRVPRSPSEPAEPMLRAGGGPQELRQTCTSCAGSDLSVGQRRGRPDAPRVGGKSTVLRCINLLEVPTDGGLIVLGVLRLPPHGQEALGINSVRRRVGMVFQRFNLFPHLTALR